MVCWMCESFGGREEPGKECRIFLTVIRLLSVEVTKKGWRAWCLLPCDFIKTASPGETFAGCCALQDFVAFDGCWEIGCKVAESRKK